MSFEERAIFKYEFPLMGSVRVSLVAEHDQTSWTVKTETQLKNRDMLSLLCRLVERISCLEISVFDNCNLTCRYILYFNLIPLSILLLREQDHSCAISNLRVSTVRSARLDRTFENA